MKTKMIQSVIPATMLLFVLHCSPGKIDGNGTQTGNPAIAGVLYNSNGTRAAHAKVTLVPSGFNPHGSVLPKTIASASATFDSTFTDDTGAYRFDTIPADTYNVLSSGNGHLCFHDSVKVHPDSHCVVPPDTLKAPGSLNGIIQLQGTDNPTTVFILVFGTNVWTAPQDSTGNFGLTNMAEGSYHVRILTTLDAYKPLDTTLKIKAGKIDTLPRPIQLQYTGIPIPMGVHIQYDTMKQIVTLLWNKPTTGRAVKSFNIYRGNVDSNKTPTILNTQIVTDTVYHDSTGVQDMSYEYHVAAVDSNGGEGTKSAGVRVIIAPIIKLVDSIGVGIFQGYQVFNFDNKGNLFIADIFSNSWKYYTYNSILTLKSSVNNFGLNYPSAIDFDSSGNLYILNQNGIFKIDSNGTKIDTISTITNNENKNLLIDKNYIWITSGYIAKISLDGKTLDTTAMIGADGLVFNKDTLLIGGNGSILRLFDQNLIQLQNWQINFHSGEIAWGLTKDEQENVYVAGYHSNPDIYTILIYDLNRKYKGRFNLGFLAKNIKVINSMLYISNGRLIKICRIN